MDSNKLKEIWAKMAVLHHEYNGARVTPARKAQLEKEYNELRNQYAQVILEANEK